MHVNFGFSSQCQMPVMKGALRWTAPKLLQLLFNFIMQLFYVSFSFVYVVA